MCAEYHTFADFGWRSWVNTQNVIDALTYINQARAPCTHAAGVPVKRCRHGRFSKGFFFIHGASRSQPCLWDCAR